MPAPGSRCLVPHSLVAFLTHRGNKAAPLPFVLFFFFFFVLALMYYLWAFFGAAESPWHHPLFLSLSSSSCLTLGAGSVKRKMNKIIDGGQEVFFTARIMEVSPSSFFLFLYVWRDFGTSVGGFSNWPAQR